MKNIKVTMNITFDDEPNSTNDSSVNQPAYPPRNGFNFLSTTMNKPWIDFIDKKIAADRKTAVTADVITFPSCELLRRNHVSTGKK